ncbi:MAG: glycosyltransferase family 4 protein [Chthonomonadales bacterium]|nr:glycosyltransferase family 4 protein [Chthonomonadales bacterium]
MTNRPAVILSTFPPLPCGIARYAAQHVEYLRRQGREVHTVGLPGSTAEAVVDARGGRRPLDVLAATRHLGLDPATCELSIHWHDGHYFAGGFSERIPTALALASLFGSFGQTELICHETYVAETVASVPKRILRSVYNRARYRAWMSADRLAFHSENERKQAEHALGRPFPASKVIIRGHSAFLLKYRDLSREAARAELGIDPAALLFLCIGFLSEHKGFHLAVEAFSRLEATSARLAIVGSIREDGPDVRDYVARLRALAGATDRVEMHEEFVSDEAYDIWNAAADVIVAPYQRAFSSGVVARAKLFGKPVIVTNVGGLADQADAGDRVIQSADELVDAMQSFLAGVP